VIHESKYVVHTGGSHRFRSERIPVESFVSGATLRLAVEDHEIVIAPGVGPRVHHLRSVILTGVANDELIRTLGDTRNEPQREIIGGGRGGLQWIAVAQLLFISAS
jgi:hypothetical protein